ncbi:hypothetical protein Acr_24g0007830 [Actinidia rufa]|uniref:Uncharacterized protein n=1 Tax=Actinidia rufa TaxID=165716 RepID=A0A7J0GUX5_9ERIC|nr:hypothetical protein Acr_24g0007830 [Actinidia rufa]
MEDILFCKDLHDPYENKEDKHVVKKDEEWRKMNRKTIGLIRQCIRYELTSADLQFDNKMQALLLLSSFPESWETLVVSLSNSALNEKLTTSMVMDALFNEKAWRREMGTTDQNIAATIVMADEDESDVLLAALEDGKSNCVLDLGSAYHLCRDREVFSTYSPYEGRVRMVNSTASRVVDSKGCSFDASRGTQRVSKENKEMLWRKKTRGLYRLEGSVQTGRAIVRHGSSEDPEQYKSTERCFGICTEVWPDTSGATSAGCPERSSDEGDQVDFEKLYSEGRGDVEASLFHSRFDQWQHLDEKVQALRCGGAYTSVGSGVAR